MKWLCVFAGIILLLAIPSWWPYSFYILLRWFISIFSLLIAYRFYTSKITPWALVFGSITFLFNPVVPIYLSKSVWVSIDFISAILFFIASGSIRKTK